jgi:hypothetical protein
MGHGPCLLPSVAILCFMRSSPSFYRTVNSTVYFAGEVRCIVYTELRDGAPSRSSCLYLSASTDVSLTTLDTSHTGHFFTFLTVHTRERSLRFEEVLTGSPVAGSLVCKGCRPWSLCNWLNQLEGRTALSVAPALVTNVQDHVAELKLAMRRQRCRKIFSSLFFYCIYLHIFFSNGIHGPQCTA